MRGERVLLKSVRTMSTSRQEHITTSLSSIISTIKSGSSSSPARLVAVSKYIPTEDIRCAYTAGQRHFGENYIQELVTKSVELPDDIKWHFIGTLQSNKCKMLVERVKNLWCVETVDSEKKARLLESGAAAIERKELLKVFVQVNTSGEEQKAGVAPCDVVFLVKYVREQCPHLEFSGLMTIGSASASHGAQEQQKNPDFETLIATKENLLKVIPQLENVELSMGMSDDFEVAVKMGSTNVRVGSKIFGQRPTKEAAAKGSVEKK